MANFNEQQLVPLIRKTCQQPHGSLERQEGLTEIVKSVQGRLWKDSSPHYRDALQRTWLYFCRNLCEARTAPQFDPNRASVVTWLNAYLKGELTKSGWQDGQAKQRMAPPVITSGGEIIDPLDAVPAPSDLPPMLETTREWAETDPAGELRRIHLKENSKVTCQVVILRRLPPETPWKVLSDEFNVPIATLSTFYRRQCLPRLRKFGEEQGYL